MYLSVKLITLDYRQSQAIAVAVTWKSKYKFAHEDLSNIYYQDSHRNGGRDFSKQSIQRHHLATKLAWS